MAAIGAARLSLKVAGPWQGMTLLSKSTPGQFILLENGYVNSDGSEIRMMPGYLPVIDPETKTRDTAADTTLGYRATHIDARRPVHSAFAGNAYYQIDEASPTEAMNIWTEPGLMHCVEQVHGRWLFVGESDVRREPILNNARTPGTYVFVTSYEDNGADIILTVNVQPSTTANLFNAITVGDRITLDRMTGSLATVVNNKGHTVLAFPTATTIRIDTSSGAVVAPIGGQTGMISRVPSNTRNPGGISDDTFSDLTLFTSLAKGDQDTAPSELVRPAHVANRMRDFGDAVGNLKEGNANAATVNSGISRRRRPGTPYRVVPHVAGNRLILAMPGTGVVMQCPVVIPPSFTGSDTADGIGALGNDIYDRPRALGIPKAVVWEDPEKAVPGSFNTNASGSSTYDDQFGGSTVNGPARAGTYKFKFAYLDEATGETGLCSEPITVTSNGGSALQGFVFWIYFPGYLMHETLACAINVYRTTKGGQTFFFDRTIRMTSATSTLAPGAESGRYGLTPESLTVGRFLHVHYQAAFISDTELTEQLNPVPDVLEQMPMGCKAARTIRGFTFFGGALGDAGSRKEMFKGSITFEFRPGVGAGLGIEGIYPNNDEVTFAFNSSVVAPIVAASEGVEDWFMVGARNIPGSYAGQTIVGRQIAPWPRKSIDLKKIVNTEVGFLLGAFLDLMGRVPDVRFSVRDTPIAQSEIMFDATRRKITAFLKLPRARLQISEPDSPNIVPATNTTILANEIDDDIEGIGDAGGQAIICTQAKTYLLGFSQSPLNVPPSVADERFGCIAPNTMVSFEGGCAWISDRGPVAFMGGGVQWIGQPLAPLFLGETAIYQRDGDGMMRHSWACHDAERSLLYFGVFSDRNAGTALEVKIQFNQSLFSWEQFRGLASQDLAWSRFPCDEVLVFSYRMNAWSVWKPPQPIQWMTRGVDADGINRVFFLGQDRRLYVLDDTWAQGDKEAWSFTAPASSTSNTFTSSVTHIPSWLGLTVAVIRNTAGVKTIIDTAIVIGEVRSGGNTTVTLDSTLTMAVGDRVTIGYRSMRLRTTFLNAKQSDTAHGVAAGIRYALDSRKDVGGPGPYEAFVSAKLVTGRMVDNVPTRSEQSLNADDSGAFRWLGSHGTDDPVREVRLVQGRADGQNHLVDVTVLGSAQVRLQDLYTEVA